ncbi:MAG: hypothetical protein NVSMB9_29530 [Isosphaeraceae bacterium]
MREPSRKRPDELATPGPTLSPLTEEDIVRQFVEHWGMMARAWGINSTMGELFALLYVTATDWTADALRKRLQVSRGNVSMNLRELTSWGVVHKIHRTGERREFFRAEGDVWALFRRILAERKRRELDPTLHLLEETETLASREPAHERLSGRISALRQFFSLIDTLSANLMKLEPEDLVEIHQLFLGDDPAPEVTVEPVVEAKRPEKRPRKSSRA